MDSGYDRTEWCGLHAGDIRLFRPRWGPVQDLGDI